MIKHEDFRGAPIWPEPPAVFSDVVETVYKGFVYNGLIKGLIAGAIIGGAIIAFIELKDKK